MSLSYSRTASAVVAFALVVASCTTAAAHSAGDATSSASLVGTPVGTYALDAAPVGRGDSSRLEIGETDGVYWGQWVRSPNLPIVPITDAQLRGTELSLVITAGNWTAPMQLHLSSSGAFTGEWLRDGQHIAFTGIKRSSEVPASVRLLASVAPLAPGVISTRDSGESFGTLSPDGRELYYTLHRADFSGHHIVVSRFDGVRWSRPEALPFSAHFNDREPKLSPDGRRLWFSSNRPASASDSTRRRDLDVWFVDRTADGWSAPHRVEAPVNSDAQEFSPVVVANGTLYFIGSRAGGIAANDRATLNVWRARPIDAASGTYAEPENLGPAINTGRETNVYVTPDERVMYVSRDGDPQGLGGDDLFMSEQRNGEWQPMRHVAAPINSPAYDYGPVVTPDGRSLLFTSWRRGTADIYRVDLSSIALTPASTSAPSDSADRAAVRRAVLDYVEGFYEGDTAKLVRSLRPELFKVGFWRPRDSTAYQSDKMSYAEALAYARNVRARNRPAPPTAPKEVTIYEVQNRTASAKVRAFWGTDYVLLGKFGDRWMISSVMWQSPPPPAR